jgi:hypothetical protein
VWAAAAAGRRLTFHLAGINNQNFLMQDEETGSWWQQVSGEAIHGPLAGTHLQLVPYEEVSFGLWRREHPAGRVLRPAESLPWKEFSADWEAQTARLPVPGRAQAGPLPPRTVVVGVERGGAAKAYPRELVTRLSPILDSVGGVPVVILTGEDGRSLRVFEARLAGRPVTLYVKAQPAGDPGGLAAAAPRRWFDAETGSEWDFSGQALSGPAAGRRLDRVPALQEYWFDWRIYHPRTAVYETPGAR